jgi:hypothetical protein
MSWAAAGGVRPGDLGPSAIWGLTWSAGRLTLGRGLATVGGGRGRGCGQLSGALAGPRRAGCTAWRGHVSGGAPQPARSWARVPTVRRARVRAGDRASSRAWAAAAGDRGRVVYRRGRIGSEPVVGGAAGSAPALGRGGRRGTRGGVRTGRRRPPRVQGSGGCGDRPGWPAGAAAVAGHRAGRSRRHRGAGSARAAAGRAGRRRDPGRGAAGADRAADRLPRAVAPGGFPDGSGHRGGGAGCGPGRDHHRPAGRRMEVRARPGRPAPDGRGQCVDRRPGGGGPARARGAYRAGQRRARRGHL